MRVMSDCGITRRGRFLENKIKEIIRPPAGYRSLLIRDLSSVTVTPECGARRGHRGRVRGWSGRRDGNQRGQRESSDERFHDTSPGWTIVRGFVQGGPYDLSMLSNIWRI